ncbi:caspase recruitment domain-containing protein 9-like [Montipora capricornis]|uniref:caspase recruitment domain-containing protein 9-like n=1 Tax=Montipora capricornis TaxID=246305 RepID=UPI0035F1A5DB
MEDATFDEILDTNRVEIVQRLQLDRTFLFDYLRSKQIFDVGDCELVRAEKTREQRAGKFLDVLITKGEEGYLHFIDAIQLLNPSLYEKITGQKATARPSPLMMGGENFFLGSNNYGPDVDIMSNHLKRTMSDLQDLTIRYDEVLKEKAVLEKRLSRTSKELFEKNQLIDELEKRYFDTEAMLMESHSSAKKVVEGAAQHQQEQNREMLERTHFIIALQMKLLSTKEEVDKLKEKLEESNNEKENLLNRFSQISKNYDNQRRESMKLTEKLDHQKDNVQRAEELKVKVRQLQFSNQKLKQEKDEALRELEDLKCWTEALKARYDIVEEDRKQTQESHESTVADYSELRDKADELELRLTISGREIEDLKKRCKDYEQTSNTYREQRDLYEKAWKETAAERDEVRKDREETMCRLTEVVRSRDEAIDRQMEYSRQFELQYKKTAEELHQVRERLYQTELEMEDLRKVKLQRNPSDVSDSAFAAEKKTGKSFHIDTEAAMVMKLERGEEMEENSPLESTHSSEDSYDWRSRRKTTEIIDSVKKRVAMQKSPTNEQNIDSVEDSPKKNLSLDNKLEELIPERRSLSPAAQNSLSLDRNRGRSLFKSAPTYSTLECMFGPSVSNSPSIYSAFDSNNSLYSSFRSCRSGILGLPQKLSGRCDKSSEHAALDDEKPKADEREREREGETESPTRPGYFKSISSPSKVFNFVRRHKSAESSGSSFDENGDHLDSTVSEHFKDPPSNVPMSITLETGDDEEKRRSELEEIEQALKSPTLQKSSFRKRSGALSAEDRPRSSSAPNSPSPRVRQRADVEEISSL